jgi:hypothetical protein
MSEIGPLCKTPLAQENMNTFMAGIHHDEEIHKKNEEAREKLLNGQN